MYREYFKCRSRHLDREMELLVFGHAGARVLVFPTRMGRFFEYENHGMVEALKEFIDSGWLQLFCVDSVDAESLYCDGIAPRERIERHLRYEKYVVDEVLPFSRELNANETLIAHGCSLGAYHALNAALRHPALFTKVVALSGRYDLTRIVPDFSDLFSGYYDEDIYFNQPSHYLPQIVDARLLDKIRQLEIVMVIGDEDPFFANNWELKCALEAKGVPLEFHVWGGRAHRFHYWRQMVRLYL